jgi:hypothetical protein
MGKFPDIGAEPIKLFAALDRDHCGCNRVSNLKNNMPLRVQNFIYCVAESADSQLELFQMSFSVTRQRCWEALALEKTKLAGTLAVSAPGLRRPAARFAQIYFDQIHQ